MLRCTVIESDSEERFQLFITEIPEVRYKWVLDLIFMYHCLPEFNGCTDSVTAIGTLDCIVQLEHEIKKASREIDTLEKLFNL